MKTITGTLLKLFGTLVVLGCVYFAPDTGASPTVMAVAFAGLVMVVAGFMVDSNSDD